MGSSSSGPRFPGFLVTRVFIHTYPRGKQKKSEAVNKSTDKTGICVTELPGLTPARVTSLSPRHSRSASSSRIGASLIWERWIVTPISRS